MRGLGGPARAATLALFGILALGPALAAQPATGLWYASDPAGFALERLSGPAGSGYELLVESLPGRTRRVLYRDGEPLETRLKEFRADGRPSREAVERGGRLTEETRFDEAGRPSVERRFLEGGATAETSYRYEGGRLVSKETLRDGVVERYAYRYAADGRPLSAALEGGLSLGGSDPRAVRSSHWSAGPDGLTLRGYDASGRLVEVGRYEGALLVSLETIRWQEGRMASSRLVRGDEETVTDYLLSGPALGLAASRTLLSKDAIVSVTRYGYDEAGRLASERGERGALTTILEYAYDPEGGLVSVTETRNSAIVKATRYESGSVRIEDTYQHGVVVARVRYVNGRRASEEIMRNGVPVRTRVFE